MTTKDLQFIQRQLGYSFKNLDLLQQAFVRRSYSEENGGENNEVLEFIGDKVLDLFAVKLLTKQFGFMTDEYDDFDPVEDCNEFVCEKNEAQLTEIKTLLVQKKTLAERVDALGFADYLIMGRGDIKRNAHRELSVMEDLFEAILGAIAIDSSWDMTALESAVEIMLAPEHILKDQTATNYLALIEKWFSKRYHAQPVFDYSNASFDDGNALIHPANEIRSQIKREPGFHIVNVQEYWLTHFKCWIELYGKRFIGYGASKSSARQDVCKLLYTYLQKNNLLFTIRDEIENPNKNHAINQLETLARRSYFSIPTYDFKQNYGQNGNPVWHCTCRISEEDRSFCETASSKMEAKKSSAYKMLLHVLDSRK